jgi:hypothetical protein
VVVLLGVVFRGIGLGRAGLNLFFMVWLCLCRDIGGGEVKGWLGLGWNVNRGVGKAGDSGFEVLRTKRGGDGDGPNSEL